MTLEQIKKIIKEISERYKIAFTDYHEEVREGTVKFVDYTLRFKVEKE